MQLSNQTATTDQMWNWQSNTVAGMRLLATSESAADVFWLSNWNTANGLSVVKVGNDTESLCTFDPAVFGRSQTGQHHSYADAITLKRYNSAKTNHDYIEFDVYYDPQASPVQQGISPIGTVWTQPLRGSPTWTAPGPPQPNLWYVQQLAGNLTNYVQAVCSYGN